MQEIYLENIIIGRVNPHIYAFTTETVPNYLKVGDTYRPVSMRLKEWKEHFPDLKKQYEETAKVDDNVYFRDFSIHHFLENEKGRIRLKKEDIGADVYYSKEFFKEASINDVAEAIKDITCDYKGKGGKYQFYNAETRLENEFKNERTEEYEPRPNQCDTIRRFKTAVDSGRRNLLMYAVMRFGKSFTSMCCAVENSAKIVVIVSAKADVKNEWKKTVESHIKFADYVFLDGYALSSNERIIRNIIDDGKKVVVFLTLQDLQGESIKEKHKEIFENEIDLLIIDETHFGARAEKYGQVLREMGKETAKATIGKNDADDFVEASEADKEISKVLKAKIKLHLSGTPYRILMGSEFTKDDIIAFYQFSDIVKDQEKWDRENILSDDVKEWDNPYYGFPQMVRFALNPNESSCKRLKELKKDGVSFALSSLLKPKSIKKQKDGSHKQFVYEREILDLLEVIDGSKKDDELLGFLDYDKIKDGSMCRHIVMVLPYCASCDAMEVLINNNADKFKNLNSYKVINISGLEVSNDFSDPQKIKKTIHECEQKNKKTLTLTVNRMLTGSTVEEWDTMLFLKDTASPQEYDQAIFRLQNQYIKEYVNEAGDVIKYNMKPQTLLVDFDPARMFSMQEQKAQIYNVNVDEAGNSKLEERLKEELRISPIIVMNSDKMEQVEAFDILNAVSEYSKNRGVAEETLGIPVDLSLMDIEVIRKAIERENELGSKAGLTTKANEGKGEGSEVDTGDSDKESDDENNIPDKTATEKKDKEEKNDPEKQFRSYYARILFFAFLTKDNVISLEDIIIKIETEDNARIAKNIGISKLVLESIKDNINKFILRDLDYKIYNLNKLSNDTTVNPLEKASVAIRKFGRLGISEVVTPRNICDEMVAIIPDDGFISAVKNGHKVLDFAGKVGEFALAIYERYMKLGYGVEQIKDTIYTIPTSGLTYEFTRMIYEILGLNINNIAAKFNDYDLLKFKDKKGNIDCEKICAILSQNKPFSEITIEDEPAEGDEKVKFDVIVGNPPYNEMDGGAQASAKPIYQYFVETAKSINPQYLSFIMPTRWYAGGKGLDEFRDNMLNDIHIEKLFDCISPEEVFPNTNIRGGVCYFLRNNKFDSSKDLATVITIEKGGIATETKRSLKVVGLDIFVRYGHAIKILNKVCQKSSQMLDKFVSPLRPFGLRGYFIKDKNFRDNSNGLNEPIICYGKGKQIGFVDKSEIPSHKEWVDIWKLYTPRANNIGTELSDDNLNSFIGEPNTICTESYIVLGVSMDLDKIKCVNFSCYLKTKFARFMHSIAKASQDATAKTYRFVPLQDFTSNSDIDWSKSIPEIDQQLYAKYGLSEDEIEFIEEKIKAME